MAKVRLKVTGSLTKQMSSDKLAAQLEAIASPVLQEAKGDPNAYYVSTLRMRRFYSHGKQGRVSIQIGAGPKIGSRVEAKRGTLARALGRLGL